MIPSGLHIFCVYKTKCFWILIVLLHISTVCSDSISGASMSSNLGSSNKSAKYSTIAVGENVCVNLCDCDVAMEHLNCTARVLSNTEALSLPNTAASIIYDNNHLTVIPLYLLVAPSLRFLSIRYNRITVIDNTTRLCQANQLQHLYADHNRISFVSPEAFTGCTDLTTLYLKSNLLTIDLVADLLPFVPKLNVLDCGFNQFGTPTTLPTQFEAVANLHALFLDKMEIQYIPSDFAVSLNASNLLQLSLAGNILLKISPIAFDNFTSLETLNISETELSFNSTLSLFNGLSNSEKLRNLDMRSNYIMNDMGDFKLDVLFQTLENTSLRILNMQHNPVAFNGFLNRTVFASLVHLQELYLDYNQLRNIHHNALGNNHKLKVLSLKNNYISCLTNCHFLSAGARLPQLQKLDLSYNAIDDVTHNNFAFNRRAFPQLKHLNLRHNHISRIPGYSFPQLQDLDLSQNAIDFDDMIKYMYLTYDVYPQLRHLILRDNRILRIPGDLLFEMNSLKSIDLSHNPIEFIDRESFVTQLELTKLEINDCNLQVLPPMAFSGLRSLVELQLSSNSIHTVYKDTWLDLDSLEHLYLDNNDLDFSYNDHENKGHTPLSLDCVNLTAINLSYNNIETIPEGFITNGSLLRSMLLSHNRIANLKLNLFRYFNNLARLDLSYNNILSIDVDVLSSIGTNLHWLDLSGNPFYCNCRILPLIAWLSKNRYMLAHERNIKCFGPNEKLGTLLLSYESSDECESKSKSSFKLCILSVALVLTTIALAIVSVLYCINCYYGRRICSKPIKSRRRPANQMTVSTTCAAIDDDVSVSETSSHSNNCDNNESTTSFLMKCIPLRLFKRNGRTAEENGHIDAPLIENLYESEANI